MNVTSGSYLSSLVGSDIDHGVVDDIASSQNGKAAPFLEEPEGEGEGGGEAEGGPYESDDI